jgi:hypothetical protein
MIKVEDLALISLELESFSNSLQELSNKHAIERLEFEKSVNHDFEVLDSKYNFSNGHEEIEQPPKPDINVKSKNSTLIEKLRNHNNKRKNVKNTFVKSFSFNDQDSASETPNKDMDTPSQDESSKHPTLLRMNTAPLFDSGESISLQSVLPVAPSTSTYSPLPLQKPAANNDNSSYTEDYEHESGIDKESSKDVRTSISDTQQWGSNIIDEIESENKIEINGDDSVQCENGTELASNVVDTDMIVESALEDVSESKPSTDVYSQINDNQSDADNTELILFEKGTESNKDVGTFISDTQQRDSNSVDGIESEDRIKVENNDSVQHENGGEIASSVVGTATESGLNDTLHCTPVAFLNASSDDQIPSTQIDDSDSSLLSKLRSYNKQKKLLKQQSSVLSASKV